MTEPTKLGAALVVTKVGLAVASPVPPVLPKDVVLDTTHLLTSNSLILMALIPVAVHILVENDVWVQPRAPNRCGTDPEIVMVPLGLSVWLPTMN